jgi:hypothetical protein
MSDEARPNPTTVARKPLLAGAVAAIGLAIITVAAVSQAARANSATWDESLYMYLGREAIIGQGIDSFAALGVAPLPVRLSWTANALAPIQAEPADPREFRQRVDRARRNAMWWFAVPLIVTIVAWVASVHGVAAAAVAGAVIAMSPNVIAHASLATTDVAFTLTFVWAVVALTLYLRARTAWAALGLAVALGVALATKYSAIGLYITAVIVFLLHRRPGALRRDAGVLAAAVGVAWALHGFAVGPMITSTGFVASLLERVPGGGVFAGWLSGMPAPIMLRGIAAQVFLERQGQEAFLLGDVSSDGWWYYFPVALAMKSTPVELLAALAFAGLAVVRRMRDIETRVVVVTVVVFGGVALMGRRDLGIRYVLPVVVLVIVAAIAWAADRLRQYRGAWIAGVLVVIAQAVTFASIAPQHLAYFNPLAGGPESGYKRLVDSNLDWGQDLVQLTEWMAANRASDVGIAYFGSAPLSAYDGRINSWRAMDRDVPAGQDAVVVISATYLQGIFLCGDPFAGFRRLEPSGRIGYSLLAYSAQRPEVRDAIRSAAADPCAP